MKRWLCLLLVFVFMFSFCLSAFADSEVMYCRMCGQKIPADSNFCPYCGVSVVPLEPNAAAKASAASPKSDAPSAAQSTPAASASKPDYSSILNRVRVTKNPTSESVPYGGSCTFIAHAANATSVTWIITTSDGSVSAPAYDAANSISGLYVSGGNTDTLKLSGIPSWMNGCSVQACFTGEGGPVYSEAARIWTYQQSSSSDEGEMLWWWPYRYLAWWWVDPYAPGPGPRPRPESTNVYHIGHESELYPWTSWFNPYGVPIPQGQDNDFHLDGSEQARPNPGFTPIAEGGGNTGGNTGGGGTGGSGTGGNGTGGTETGGAGTGGTETGGNGTGGTETGGSETGGSETGGNGTGGTETGGTETGGNGTGGTETGGTETGGTETGGTETGGTETGGTDGNNQNNNIIQHN